jgi:hypothetical protein
MSISGFIQESVGRLQEFNGGKRFRKEIFDADISQFRPDVQMAVSAGGYHGEIGEQISALANQF